MRENTFIDQNKEKWSDFEALMQQKERNPDELSESFVEITDDLSYARTFYPNRSVRLYLNSIAQQVFRDVYKNKRVKWYKLIEFWTRDLPATMYFIRKDLLIAFLIFFVALLVGVFSTVQDPEFTSVILGDDYVQMTKENIAKGDPMAVYKDDNPVLMFFQITFNNLRVAFLSFIMGALFCVGTILITIYNGIMVGSFQYFFYAEDVLIDSVFAIWLHGTLEISSIVIASAAGITMGKGLLFPGTLSRLESFQISARRGLKVMLGLVPIIITAGFIESFLTRYTEMPLFIRGAVILASAAFMIGYFVWYPYQLVKYKKIEIPVQKLPEQTEDSEFTLFQIRTLGNILTESIMIHRRQMTAIFNFNMAFLFPFTLVMYLIIFGDISEFDFPNDLDYRFETYYELILTGNYLSSPVFVAINALLWACVLTVPYYLFSKTVEEESRKVDWSFVGYFSFLLRNGYKSLIIVLLMKAIVYPDPKMLFVIALTTPFLLFWLMAWTNETNNPFKAIGRAAKLFFFQPMDSFMMMVITVLVGCVYLLLILSPLTGFFVSIIKMHFIEGETLIIKIVQVFYLASILCGFFFIVPIFVYAVGIQYFSVMERAENTTLKKKIAALEEQHNL